MRARMCNIIMTKMRGHQAKKQYSELILERVIEQSLGGKKCRRSIVYYNRQIQPDRS